VHFPADSGADCGTDGGSARRRPDAGGYWVSGAARAGARAAALEAAALAAVPAAVAAALPSAFLAAGVGARTAASEGARPAARTVPGMAVPKRASAAAPVAVPGTGDGATLQAG